MILEFILLSELMKTPSGKFTIFGRKAEETSIVLPVEPKKPAVVGKSFAESLTALTYPEGWDEQNIVVNITPEEIAIYKESENVKKALRGL